MVSVCESPKPVCSDGRAVQCENRLLLKVVGIVSIDLDRSFIQDAGECKNGALGGAQKLGRLEDVSGESKFRQAIHVNAIYIRDGLARKQIAGEQQPNSFGLAPAQVGSKTWAPPGRMKSVST